MALPFLGYILVLPFQSPGNNGAIIRPMYFTYILLSQKSHIFYYGSTSDLKARLMQHNTSISPSTKPHIPWNLVWYCAFTTLKEAKDFEMYLKSGSGKAFAYNRLVSSVLAKDFAQGRVGSPKL